MARSDLRLKFQRMAALAMVIVTGLKAVRLRWFRMTTLATEFFPHPDRRYHPGQMDIVREFQAGIFGRPASAPRRTSASLLVLPAPAWSTEGGVILGEIGDVCRYRFSGRPFSRPCGNRCRALHRCTNPFAPLVVAMATTRSGNRRRHEHGVVKTSFACVVSRVGKCQPMFLRGLASFVLSLGRRGS